MGEVWRERILSTSVGWSKHMSAQVQTASRAFQSTYPDVLHSVRLSTVELWVEDRYTSVGRTGLWGLLRGNIVLGIRGPDLCFQLCR